MKSSAAQQRLNEMRQVAQAHRNEESALTQQADNLEQSAQQAVRTLRNAARANASEAGQIEAQFPRLYEEIAQHKATGHAETARLELERIAAEQREAKEQAEH